VDPSRHWYRLCGVRPPWGDYGDILLSGMTTHQPRTQDGLLQLERTGPFVPPITLPGCEDPVVTDAFRARLEHSPLAGLGFRPVRKARIVRLEWERWDQASSDPAHYPAGGEPEAYIPGRPHDSGLAAQIGQLWEVVSPLPTRPSRADRVFLARARSFCRAVRPARRADNFVHVMRPADIR
jgi:hypothetical protein